MAKVVAPNEEKLVANISAIADYLNHREIVKNPEIKDFKKELETKRIEFLDKFSIEELEKIAQEDLFNTIFGNKKNGYDSLKYNLNNKYYEIFGSPGQSGTARIPDDWDGNEFLSYIKSVDQFIKEQSFDHTLSSYKELWEIVADGKYFPRAWVKKYLHLLYPDIFVSQLSPGSYKDTFDTFRMVLYEEDYINEFQLSTLSDLTSIPTDYFWKLGELLGFNNSSTQDKKYKEVRKMTELYETNYTKPEKYSFNCIFFGAPGTGKSHELEDQRKELLEEELLGEEKVRNQYERVTFHPDYSYANFVGTYKPVPVEQNGEETISYRYVPGPFMRILVKALINSAKSETEDAKPYLLIIEEINRANVAAVFGDVFQLLDRKAGKSEYEIHLSEDMKNYIQKSFDEAGIQPEGGLDTIKLPDNLFIWATMNSADQGVFPMDTAFKRRWDFEYIGINDGEAGKDGKDGILDYTFTLGEGNSERKVNWNQLRKAINNCLSEEGINEDKLMGPYFISLEKLRGGDEVFINAFKNKVLMYLFDDAAKHKRSKVFSEEINSNIYSKICEEFDKKGVFVFADKISAQFKEPRDPQPASEQSQEDNS